MAADANGNLYLIDNRVIRKLTSAGQVTTVAGFVDPNATSTSTIDGTGAAASFESPSGIAVSPSGDIYICDSQAQVIRKMTAAGAVTTVAGKVDVQGAANGPFNQGTLSYPSGVAVDTAGNVYIADYGNSLIRKMTPSGVLSTVAGIPGSSGRVDGPGWNAQFSAPEAVTVDPVGNIFVLDGDHSIRIISPSGTVSTLVTNAGDDGDPADLNSGAISINNLTMDASGNLYTTKYSNQSILKVTPIGSVASMNVTAMPASIAAQVGATATLSVSVTSVSGLHYDWQVSPSGQSTWSDISDGPQYSGSNTANLQVLNLPPAATGSRYRCIISNGGAVNRVSAVAVLSVISSNTGSRLTNISTRANVGIGANVEIAGFIISGSGPQQILIRANGPALQASGLATGYLMDPVLTLHATDPAASVIATNDNWGDDPSMKSQIAAATSAVGAPAWGDGSKDAAILTLLNPGGYTAVVESKDGTQGVGLIEVFAVDPANGAGKVINVSSRTGLATGANVQIAGFIITGTTAKRVVIRATGPSLSKYNVSNPLADPKIELHSAVEGQPLLAVDEDWDATAQRDLFKSLGVDNWEVGSKDAAIITTLQPGGYTAVVSGADGGSGVALIEVFDADSN